MAIGGRRSTTTVSVVIPTRNRREVIQRSALRSALSQVDVDVEVIVVDDCSDDGTPEALETLGEDRVRVIRQRARRGQAHARNQGIAVAHGEWIAFLDD